jgi:hypothetical protein
VKGTLEVQCVGIRARRPGSNSHREKVYFLLALLGNSFSVCPVGTGVSLPGGGGGKLTRCEANCSLPYVFKARCLIKQRKHLHYLRNERYGLDSVGSR